MYSFQHAKARVFWQQAADKLRVINVTTHDADAWGGVGVTGPDNVVPAMEDSNISLKAAIQDEIIGFATNALESMDR